jgi:hypothetical protein
MPKGSSPEQRSRYQHLDTKISIVSSVIFLFCYPSSDTIPQNVNLLKFLFNIPDPQLQKRLSCLGTGML